MNQRALANKFVDGEIIRDRIELGHSAPNLLISLYARCPEAAQWLQENAREQLNDLFTTVELLNVLEALGPLDLCPVPEGRI